MDREQRRIVVRLRLDELRAGSASAERIASMRPGSSVPGVRTPTQTSPPGSCRRQSSDQTTGIARVIALTIASGPVRLGFP